MSVLTRQEAEIPLNGGQDDTAGAEYQAVTTMRAVTDLRWNNGGELEKRPATASTQAIVNPGSLGMYDGLGGAGLIESRGEVYAITDNYGAMNSAGRYVGAGGSLISIAQIPFSYDLTPKLCKVSRRQIDRCSGGDNDQGFAAFASCMYSTTTLVTAAVVYVASGSGCVLRLRAVSIDTGAVYAQLQVDTDVASAAYWCVDACENTDVTAPGAVVTFGSGSGGGVYAIKKYRYVASSQSFVSDGNIVTDADSPRHRIKTSPSAAGRFLMAYETNGGALYAFDANCTTGTAVSTHTGTHSAVNGVDIAISGTKVFLASITATTLYAERYGTPATAITIEAAGGTETFGSVTCARQTRTGGLTDTAAVIVGVADIAAGVIPDYFLTFCDLVDFASTTCTLLQGRSVSNALNIAPLGYAVTFDDKAYVLAYPGLVQGESPTPAWVRCDNTYSVAVSTMTVRSPVARLCHGVFAAPVFMPGLLSALFSTFATSTGLVATIPTDLSVDEMPGPLIRVGQSIALCTVDMQPAPATSAQHAGVATVASGVTFDIDGDMPSLSQIWCRPVVTLDSATAGSESTVTGIKVIAIYRWIDAAGRLHRSEPSASVDSGVFTTQRLDVYVTVPPFLPFSDPYRLLSVELYVTTDGGNVYYLANDASGRQHTAYAVTGGSYLFTRVYAGLVANTQVYTTGAGNEELASEPPPPFKAICTVGDRMWAIDAEDRSRIWYTKPFAAGYAPEWNSVCTLFLGDNGVGISDVGGVPTVFCERGIWQVYGEGPSSLGVGSFAPARRLPHEVACLDAVSVCKTPAGVVFRARGGVLLLDNALALQDIGKPIGSLFISGTPTGYCKIAYDEIMDELHVLDFDTLHCVFNMGENKWSKWTQDSAFQYWIDCVSVAGRMWFLQHGSGVTDSICRAKAIDESAYNTHVYGWSMTTPWIRFDGVLGNMRVWEVIPQVRLGSAVASTGTLSVLYETRDTATDTFTWTAANIIALGSAGQTVNLRCRVSEQRTRQFRITLTEGVPGAATAGHVPVGMRVLYGIQPGAERKTSTTQNKGST